VFPHVGFRGLRVLQESDPYATLDNLATRSITNYINGANPETFFLEVKTTLASLGAIGTGSVDLRTAQQDRPLLVLGAASNVDGCQIRMSSEKDYYQFTYQEKPAAMQFPDAATYHDPPLMLIAPNTDYRNTSLFNMWPVPHLLEAGDSFKIKLSNGCLPGDASNTGTLTQAANTRGEQDVRITFICRTV